MFNNQPKALWTLADIRKRFVKLVLVSGYIV